MNIKEVIINKLGLSEDEYNELEAMLQLKNYHLSENVRNKKENIIYLDDNIERFIELSVKDSIIKCKKIVESDNESFQSISRFNFRAKAFGATYLYRKNLKDDNSIICMARQSIKQLKYKNSENKDYVPLNYTDYFLPEVFDSTDPGYMLPIGEIIFIEKSREDIRKIEEKYRQKQKNR